MNALQMVIWVVTVTAMVTGGVHAQDNSLPVQTAPVVETVQPAAVVDANGTAAIPGKKPLVQLALLLDTSGSMSGLINQARAQLWSIVNEFIFARHQGLAPEIQVALFEYGNDGLSREQGYIRQIVPFSTDLDKLSEALFALTTNGGSEYCGWVIQDAVNQLTWDSRPEALKIIFIAGNEPFTQGPVDYKVSCKAAIEKGIVVNTIHCGDESQGLSGEWKNGSLLADGTFLNINHNQQIVHIAAPQDQEIARLNEQLNQTYIGYGRQGRQRVENQHRQDTNAAQLSQEAAVQRSIAKSSANYSNVDWDLVDAVKHNAVTLQDMPTEALPEPMQTMTDEERHAYVQAKAKERGEIQGRILALNNQRQQFVTAEMKKQQIDDKTLGSAIIQAIHEQAARQHYTFEKSDPTTDPNH